MFHIDSPLVLFLKHPALYSMLGSTFLKGRKGGKVLEFHRLRRKLLEKSRMALFVLIPISSFNDITCCNEFIRKHRSIKEVHYRQKLCGVHQIILESIASFQLEAIKCYRNAFIWKKDNILRDLSLLRIKMRDLKGYRETCHQLLKLRSSQHASWISFAMSYHPLGAYETANNTSDIFRSSQTVETYGYNHSELLLHQNLMIMVSGRYSILKSIERNS